MSAMTGTAGLDQFDLGILDILQRDNLTPQRAIGAAVNLSAPAVQRRIKKMQQSGVITANVAVVDPPSDAQLITVLVEVQVESERIDLLDRRENQLSRGGTRGTTVLLRDGGCGFHSGRQRAVHERL